MLDRVYGWRLVEALYIGGTSVFARMKYTCTSSDSGIGKHRRGYHDDHGQDGPQTFIGYEPRLDCLKIDNTQIPGCFLQEETPPGQEDTWNAQDWILPPFPRNDSNSGHNGHLL